eukprot:5230780-Alexandrium_andersonii.AAC.1
MPAGPRSRPLHSGAPHSCRTFAPAPSGPIVGRQARAPRAALSRPRAEANTSPASRPHRARGGCGRCISGASVRRAAVA